MSVTLAATYHDPQGRLYDQIVRALPTLSSIFDSLAIRASHVANPRSLDRFAAAGVHVVQESPSEAAGPNKLGQARREAVALALRSDHSFILYCDCDRALHWAEHYPDELAQVVAHLHAYDCIVLGRTPRAFGTHPRVQRDTEAIVNHVFALVSGHAWDVTAAARGLSRRAAAAILAGCPDENISTDVSWPLFLQRTGSFSLGYIATEGLELETADRYGDQVTNAGGVARWLDQLDADLHRWADRLGLAHIQVEAMLPYVKNTTPGKEQR